MMVTFISQCEKNALKKTRRVLDAFADRIGDNTWQTVVTEEGLNTVKKMLRQTASKSTAVSCHWLRSRSRSQFLWAVGNKSRFDERGVVPVNVTEQEISQFMDKNQWQTLDVIQYAAAISGLFHDFGKANQLFQVKLDPDREGESYEPYRHEWVSLRLLQVFVGDKNDHQWLNSLAQFEHDEFSSCFKDGLDGNVGGNHPIENLPPLAKLVAWLILTHHKLPLYPGWKRDETSPPGLEYIDQWLSSNFEGLWNSHNCKDQDLQTLFEQNWSLKKLPVESMQWRSKACMIASEARAKLQSWLQQDANWLDEQVFTTHFSRLCLMLADHYYSSLDEVTEEWRNPNYEVYANTYGKKHSKAKQHKQQLDEHLIGVAQHAQDIAKALPKLNASLESLDMENHACLTEPVKKEYKENFGWQDGARKLAQKLGKETIEQGFFGINMASTGKGKTRANAKIMAAIGSIMGRVRFNVALGLRTLTLQTGREYQDELKLTDEELAIAVGGIAVKQLFENEKSQINDATVQTDQQESTGSESQEDILDSDLYVHYKGAIKEHSLTRWTKQERRLDSLIQAPVLVCTIDHLVPATEGTKGGKQMAPMLRLLTSDLVLDEPDDFGLDDLPALCRLVNWAGMLGSRVLLSTATMPPALAYALFRAYQQGWGEYAKANIGHWDGNILCAWFDEFVSDSAVHKEFDAFKKSHEKFVRDRIKALKDNVKPQRKGKIIAVSKIDTESIATSMAKVIQENAIALHNHHQQSQDGKNISIGLVRMANINPLIAVAKELLKLDAPENTCIHYCVYHSRYPLAIRSYLENKLDRILNRTKPDEIWEHGEIRGMLENSTQAHLFVVLASPVAEVGRNHDYDWAIVEPSSMRSIIQLAGRVLRHRDSLPEEPNIYLLSHNYKALTKETMCFNRPGFESKEFQLEKHDLFKVLTDEQYQEINAIPRITLPTRQEKDQTNEDGKYLNLVDLEHKALKNRLFSAKNGVKLWWKTHPHWCGEVQRQQRFRDSKQDEAYYLFLCDKYSEPHWKWKNETVYPPKFGEGAISINTVEVEEFGKGSYFWFDLSIYTVYSKLASDFDIDLMEVSQRFGEVRLIEYQSTQQEYNYHPNLGLYKDMGNADE